jgi:hypothetical protein
VVSSGLVSSAYGVVLHVPFYMLNGLSRFSDARPERLSCFVRIRYSSFSIKVQVCHVSVHIPEYLTFL